MIYIVYYTIPIANYYSVTENIFGDTVAPSYIDKGLVTTSFMILAVTVKTIAFYYHRDVDRAVLSTPKSCDPPTKKNHFKLESYTRTPKYFVSSLFS